MARWSEKSLRAVAAISSGLLIASTVILSALDLYCHNAGEFTFRLTTILPWLFFVWMSLLLAVVGPQLLVLRWKYFSVVNAAYMAFGAAIWVQCMCLSDMFPDISFFDPDTRETFYFFAFFNIALFLGLLGVAIWKNQWVSRYAWKLSSIVILAQLLPVAHQAMTYAEPEYNYFEYTINEDREFTFASRENVVVLVLDCMSESLFKKALHDYPELHESLRDFTCFDRMESPVPRTMYAVPAMLSGMNYEGKIDEDGAEEHYRYLLRAMHSPGSLPVNFKKSGYRCEEYPYILQTISYSPELLDNVEPRREHKQSVDYFADTLVLKIIPFFVRPLVFDSYLSLTDRFITPHKGLIVNADQAHDAVFFRRLKSEFRLGDFEKGFKYLHLQGAHKPIKTDENIDLNQNTDAVRQLRGALRIVETLLEKMKDAKIYEDAVIVVTGDHSEQYTPEVATLIKRPGDHGAGLRMNAVPCQIADIAGTVLAAKALAPPEASIFSRPPVASTGMRAGGAAPIVLYAGSWRKREPLEPIPSDPLDTTFQFKKGRLEIFRPCGEIGQPCTLKFIARDLASNEEWETAGVESSGPNGPEVFHTDFNGLSDGIYRLYVCSGTVPTPGSFDVLPQVDIQCFSRFVKIEAGAVSFHARVPGLRPRPLQLNETIELQAMQPYPQLEYSDDCTFSSQYMRLSSASALRIYVPGGDDPLSLKMELNVISQYPAQFFLFDSGAVVNSMPLSSGQTQLAAEFSIPRDARQRGVLDLRFLIENRYKNRSPLGRQIFQIRRISMKRT
jgi:hypothetical protein